MRQLLKLMKRFNGNYIRMRRGVWWNKGRNSVCRIRCSEKGKLRLKRSLYRKLRKLDRLGYNYKMNLSRQGS